MKCNVNSSRTCTRTPNSTSSSGRANTLFAEGKNASRWSRVSLAPARSSAKFSKNREFCRRRMIHMKAREKERKQDQTTTPETNQPCTIPFACTRISESIPPAPAYTRLKTTHVISSSRRMIGCLKIPGVFPTILPGDGWLGRVDSYLYLLYFKSLITCPR